METISGFIYYSEWVIGQTLGVDIEIKEVCTEIIKKRGETFHVESTSYVFVASLRGNKKLFTALLL